MGLRWWHLPIVDGGVPDARFEHAWNWYGLDLRHRLLAEAEVVVDCRGGLGRIGVVAARLLVAFGEAQECALFRVRRARTGTVENPPQEYVRDLVEVQYVFRIPAQIAATEAANFSGPTSHPVRTGGRAPTGTSRDVPPDPAR